MATISDIQARVEDRKVVLKGPGGEVELVFAVETVPEASAEDPACLPRVTVEWCRSVDVDGELRLRQVVYAYTHDSYDGEHRLLLEEGWVSAPLASALLADLGVQGEPLDVARKLISIHPELRPSLEALLGYDEAVSSAQYAPMLS